MLLKGYKTTLTFYPIFPTLFLKFIIYKKFVGLYPNFNDSDTVYNNTTKTLICQGLSASFYISFPLH